MSFFKRSLRNFIKPELSTSFSESVYRQLSIEKGCFGLSDKKLFEQDVIISLTTYNKRIFDVFLTIESLFQQTVKANRIILWLARDEFQENSLPIKLLSLKKRGLEIRFCDDLKSYKKLIPTLELFPEAIIVTVDDDIIYPDDFLENMLNAYKENPKQVYCYRARVFSFNLIGNLKPYMKWKLASSSNSSSLSILPNGVGGVLYFPGCFHDSILDRDVFMKLSPKGDDIWFKAMTLLKGIKCSVIFIEKPFFEKFITIESGQDIALYHSNISSKENIKQIRAVFEYLKLDINELRNIKE